ncbi:unnamed protein product [Rotaria sp. Silwood2]|nr:unnamed protein product [Rotaria sp. Silwood2]CAF2842057.1 unnamed protein product [Rotaria sp. Silwood2]CAF3243933.1 unnamed protein product [Rotaria sp. Silwood2]CAF4409961.1 unnamed protein product [Rotaria sp. Silwood2]CAF4419259.1 unnamed protein product [Rotaria sp. Silwood2]
MSGDITGEINYFSHTTDGSPPWTDANPKLGYNITNHALAPTRVTIHDLRGRENTVDLDTNGFEILKHDGLINEVFNDNSEMQQCFYEEIATVLKKRLNASRVIIFNHITRFRGPYLPADQCDGTHKNPIFTPHVDHDPPAARFKVKRILGEEEANRVMQNRFQIINIWRPLGPNPIVNAPLTICDYRSLDPHNDVHAGVVYRSANDVTISNYSISRNSPDAHKWYYLSQMRSDEMFVFKIFDSKSDVAQFAPHTGFKNENVPSMNVEQISIELRALVLYDLNSSF